VITKVSGNLLLLSSRKSSENSSFFFTVKDIEYSPPPPFRGTCCILFYLVNKTNCVQNFFLVYLSIPTCCGRQWARHQEKQLCFCDTWYLFVCVDDWYAGWNEWWAYSRPKHVEIDKCTKNKLCTKLVYFERFVWNIGSFPFHARYKAVGRRTLFLGKHFPAKTATPNICNLSLCIEWFLYNTGGIWENTASNGGMVSE
jgi:hypothetical protein